MNLFELFVKIGVDDQASDKISGLSGKLSNGLKTAANIGAAAVGAVTTATTAMSAALIKGVSKTAEYGDNIDKMSQKMGMTSEAYQEWDAVMQHCGTSIDSMQSSMKTLASAAETNKDAFEKLGLSQESIANMSQEELFGATITALQNVESETERTYLSGQLLGRGATELGALLNTSAEDTQAMKDRVHELGGVMSDEAVKAAAAYQDSLQDMQTAFSGISRGMTAEFMPSITTIMDGLTEVFGGDGGTGIALINQGVSDFVDNLTSVIPEVLSAGAQIASGLIDSITSNLQALTDSGAGVVVQLLTGISGALPELATSAVSILEQIVTSISDNSHMLLESAMETILALANGISESLPELIPTTVDVVVQIVETLIDNADMLVDASISIINSLAEGLISALPRLIAKAPEIVGKLVSSVVNNAPKLLSAALELIVTLAKGLITSIPELIKVIPQIVTSIVSGFMSLIGKIMDIGKNIVMGIWEGIKAMASWIAEKVTGFFSGIVASVKNFLGIASPSKLFRDQIGRNIGLGVAEGLEDSKDEAVKAANKLAESVYRKSVEWLDRQTKYQKFTLSEQLQVWETIQSQFIVGSKQYLDAEEEIYDLRTKIREDFMKKASDIEKSIQSLEDEYQEVLTKRAGEIFKSYGLFDAVKKQAMASGNTLANNLRDQISNMEKFYDGLEELTERGVGTELVDEIRAMGPDALGELAALLSMSDEKLSEYAELYKEKQDLANKYAIEELEQLRKDTDEKIAANLAEIDRLYEESAPVVGLAFSDGLASGIMEGMSNVINSAVNVAQSAVEAVKDTLGIHSPSRVFAEIGKNMALGLGEGLEDEYGDIKKQIENDMDFGTATVDFASSGIGASSSNIINSSSYDNEAGQIGGPVTINLMLPDGTQFASYLLPSLISVARAGGTPIVNPS